MLFFKTDRELNEFYSSKLDNRVKIIVTALNGEFERRWNTSLIVTSVHRTKKEQISYYGYFKPSPHFSWRAVDLSLRAYKFQTIYDEINLSEDMFIPEDFYFNPDMFKIKYTPVNLKGEQVKFIDDWIDAHFKYDMSEEQKFETSVVHEVFNSKTKKSAGKHIHIQTTPRSVYTRIKR